MNNNTGLLNFTDESRNKTIPDLTTITNVSERNILKITAVVTSSLNLFVTIIAATTLLKARLIPHSIRTFVFCLFICDGFVLLSCILWAVSEHFRTLSYQLDKGFIFLEWLLTASLSIDRVMALDFPRMYLKYFGEKFIKGYVCSLFLLGVFIRLLTILVKGIDRNVLVETACKIFIAFLCIFIIVTVVCSLRIFLVCKRHIRQIRTLQITNEVGQEQRSKARSIGSSGTILIIMTAFVSLQTPFVIEMITVRCVKRPDSRLYTYPCILLSCFSNTLLYCWRFKECRMILLGWLSKVTRRLVILQDSNFLNIVGIKLKQGSSASHANVTNVTTYM